MGREDRIVENGLGKRRREETRADGVGIDPMRRPGLSHCAGQLYDPAFAGSISNAGRKSTEALHGGVVDDPPPHGLEVKPFLRVRFAQPLSVLHTS